MLDFIPTTHLQNIKHIEWWSLKAPILDFEGLTVGSFLHKKRILLFAKSALRYSLQNKNANKTGYFQCCPLLSAQQVKEFGRTLILFLLGIGYVDQSQTATRSEPISFLTCLHTTKFILLNSLH